jgi:hypothetical protein
MRLTALSLIVVWSTPVYSQYTPGIPQSRVISLGPSTFPEAVKDIANPLWFLKFYAPW